MAFKITGMLIKGFEGDAETVKAQRRPHGVSHAANEAAWRLKNDNSLVALNIDYLQYDILLKSNGGSKSFVRTKGFEILDYRKYTKLKMQKWVLLDTQPKGNLPVTRKGERRMAFLERTIDSPTQSRSTVNSDEKAKIDKIDSIKKEMFQKYFAKDDFMMSIESAIYSQASTKECDGSKLGSRKMSVSSDLSDEISVKRLEDGNQETAGSNTFTRCCTALANFFTCCKKAHRRNSKIVKMETVVRNSLVSDNHRSVKLQAVLDEEESLVLNPPRKSQDLAKKPSQVLLERFIRKEVPWVATTMEETRMMKGTGRLFSQDHIISSYLEEFDLYLEMESQWDGETFMEMKIANKTIMLLPDFLNSCLNFFKKPFTGSQW